MREPSADRTITTPRPSAVESGVVASVRWLWPYISPRLGSLLVVLTIATLVSLLATAQPYLSKLIIDEGLLARRFDYLCWLCAAIVASATLAALLGGLNRWVYVSVSGKILFSLREDIYAHLLKMPPSYFRARPVGDLVTRLDGDVAEIQRFSTDALLAFINGVLLLTATAIIMVKLSPQLSAIVAVILPLHLLLRGRARSPVAATTRAVRESSGQIAQFLLETLGAAKAVQGAAAERWEQQRLHSLNRGFLDRLLAQQMLSYVIGGASSLLSHATTAAVFVIGGYAILNYSLTIGTLVAFTSYFLRTTGSAVSLMNLYLAYQRTAVSLQRVRELLDVEAPRPGPLLAAPTRGELHFEGVHYQPDDAVHPLLQGLELRVPAGSKVVLCGESGVGKSTLVDLLLRFVQPTAGRVLIDGHGVDCYDISVLRRSIVVLDSAPMLFHGSIMHNLRYGNFQATDDSVLQAARRAGVDEFVSCLPQGYHTHVGASGSGLSTGQRQRLAIARALLGSAVVLVLDEATSNLDETATRDMHALIDEHFSTCTRLVISHAPQRVPRVEQVYQLHDGRVKRCDGPNGGA